MRYLRVILIPLVPGLFVFSYIWVVDGGGDVFTCVPGILAELAARAVNLDGSLLRRVFIPTYLLLFLCPVVGYSLKPRRQWLQAVAVLSVLHIICVIGIVLQDD